ncbi:F-box protein At1g47340-like [Eutrema salsugineum]|uniref:F-box protein At1g47340-like n=1 Tax=Eutrema salsugineum TaxID=72664 RepID=UPI000CED31C0|nr:F-box protein At1g47340-like [Eutrema salsugineum]
MNSVSIPFDLIRQTLSRLPAKSLARFRCLSKLWGSTLLRPDFTKLFLTRSSAQPRILFAIEQKGLWSFFSLPQRQIPYESSSSSSLVVAAAEFHMKFPPDNMRIYYRSDRRFACGYASGLIYLYGMYLKRDDYDGVPVICNPITGQYATLPYLIRYRRVYSFLGFDPIDRRYKVLFMACPYGPDHHRILSLGTGQRRWKKIRCSLRHEGVSEGICINGVLYYLGDTSERMTKFVIICFDVRSEKFSFIYPEGFCELINYNGKLGVVYYDDNAGDVVVFRVWVLEDAEKQEWSKYAYVLRDDMFLAHYVSVVGVIATGEIVLSMGDYTSKKPFYVFYFNPKRNTLQRVEVQGFGDYHEALDKPSRVHVFVDDCSRFYALADQLGDLNVNDPKLLNSKGYEDEDEEYNEEEEEEYDEDEDEEEGEEYDEDEDEEEGEGEEEYDEDEDEDEGEEGEGRDDH